MGSFFIATWFGDKQWLVPGDAWWTVVGSQWVSHGAIGTVYQGDPMYLPLPGLLVLLAPLVAIGDHFGLVTGLPIPLTHPSMWLLVGPTFFVLGSTCIIGADFLAATLGVNRLRRRVIVVAVGLLVVLPTCVAAGHPEDLLALTFACFSLGKLFKGRTLASALLLSVAVMMQPWAGLLIPIIAAAAPSGRRLRTAIWASLLPGSCALLLLVLNPADTYRSLVLQPMLGQGQHLPWWGFASPMRVPMEGQLVGAHVGSATRSIAVLLAVAAAMAVHRDPSRSSVLGAASVALLARAAFETQIWPWYVAPAAVMILVGAATTSDPRARRWMTGCIASGIIYGFAGDAYNGYSLPSLLALAILVLGGGAGIWAMLDQGSRQGAQARLPVSLSTADLHLAATLDSLDDAPNYAGWIHDLVKPYLGKRLLEVGAGHGTFTALFLRDGCQVVATEVSPRSARLLGERFSDRPDVAVVHGDIPTACAHGPFDSAVLINVLEHIEDDTGALRQLADLVKPGGYVAIWVPALPRLYSDFDRQVGHFRRYTREEVRVKLEAAGIQPTELRYANALGAFAWWLLAKTLRRNPTRSNTVTLFDRVVIPTIRRVETQFVPPFGQSILAVGIRP